MAASARGDRAEHFLGHVEHRAPVAVGHGFQGLARLGVERQRTPFLGLGTLQKPIERHIVETVEHQHDGARQQSAVELEGGVLGGGADERDGAVLHVRQETVLLRAVEAVDLVDEQQRALAGLALALGAVEGLAQVLHAREDGGELLEHEIGLVRQQARHGGLAGTGRAPQDHALQPAAPEHARQRALGADEMILADDLGKLARPQPVGQRPRRFLLHARGLEQICHAHADPG